MEENMKMRRLEKSDTDMGVKWDGRGKEENTKMRRLEKKETDMGVKKKTEGGKALKRIQERCEMNMNVKKNGGGWKNKDEKTSEKNISEMRFFNCSVKTQD